MSKIIRRLSLASLLLLLSAVGIYHVGEWQSGSEMRQFNEKMAASGYYISDVYSETNVWHIAAIILFLVCVSVAIAAFMLWRRDRKEITDDLVRRSLTTH